MDQMETETAGIREEQQRMNKELQKSRDDSNILIQQLMHSIQDQFAELCQSMSDKPRMVDILNPSQPQEDVHNMTSAYNSLTDNDVSVNPSQKLVSGLVNNHQQTKQRWTTNIQGGRWWRLDPEH